MALRRCPTCNREFNAADDWLMPFCSSRCQTIDLGHWLTEKYHVPHVRKYDDEHESDLAEGWTESHLNQDDEADSL